MQFLNAVIIGNVNAGKSSLCGRIAYGLGDVSIQTLLEYRKEAQQLKRESYYLAWWSDRANIERQKGITIHNHFHRWKFNNKLTINVTDISGYDYYLKNGIAGIAFNDIAILVIDIIKQTNNTIEISGIQQLPNQYYMGSVLQQLLIIKAANISKIIVVLNKCDLFLKINNFNQNYIKKSIINIKKTIIKLSNDLKLDICNTFYPFMIPISTTNGWNIYDNNNNNHILDAHANICAKMNKLLPSIHSGCSFNSNHNTFNSKSLLDIISNLNIKNTNQISNTFDNKLIASIKRVSINNKNQLLLLYCIVINGVIISSQKINVHPYNAIIGAITIYSMQSFRKTISSASSGELICIAIKLSDIYQKINNNNNRLILKYFQRGSIITGTDIDINTNDEINIINGIEYFEADLDIIFTPQKGIKIGYEPCCYSHCTNYGAKLIKCFDKSWSNINCMNSFSKRNISNLSDMNHLYGGEKVIVGFNVIDKQIVLMSYDSYPDFGWIALKDNKSYLVAIGKIIYAGRKVSKIQIEQSMLQITSIHNIITKSIISMIADYACCGC